MYKHILIPTDGSDVAEKAVAAGIEFARESGARVTFFTAVPEYQPPTECDVRAGNLVSFADSTARARRGRKTSCRTRPGRRVLRGRFDTDFVQSNQPWQAIIDAAKRQGCDAIFMASHGHNGLAAVWHSSQTREVLTHSTVPTLVYR